MKPLAYASAFERGWNPATIIMDVPTRWEVPGQEDYEPNNYTKLFYGAVPVREALAQSLNIPAVKATEYAGVAGVMDTAARMGLVTSLGNDPGFYGVSLGLGSGEVKLLEHTNAYATLANNGRFVKANPIQRILDSQGNTLMEVNKEYVDEQAKEGINPGIAYQITSILTDNEARAPIFGTNNLFGNTQDALGRPTAAKSGTTENWRDLWAMGYTTAVACGAWVGRTGDAGTAELPEIDGTDAAGPMWQDMMLLIHNDSRFAELIAGPDGNAMPENFPVPDEVREMDLCATTGHLPGNGPRVREWVVRGQEPTLACNEVNDYEAEELEKALDEVRRGGNWAGGAVGSINDYARMVGSTPIAVDDEEDDEDDGDNQIDGPDVSDDQDTDEQPPIEPLN